MFGFINSPSTINYIIQKNFQGELKIAGGVRGECTLGFGIRGDEPMLANIMEKVLSAIDEQTKQALMNQWSNVQIQAGFDYSLLWKIAALILLLGGMQ